MIFEQSSGHETSKFQITHHRFVHVYVYKVIIKHPNKPQNQITLTCRSFNK